MATIKQKLLAEKVIENNGNVSKSMREVGYSEETAKNPQQVTNSKGWQELMDKYLADDKLAKVHAEGLNATGKKPHLIDRDDKGRPIYEYIDEPDYSARHKYLDTAYKLKGSYAPDKSVSLNLNATTNLSDEQIDEINQIVLDE